MIANRAAKNTGHRDSILAASAGSAPVTRERLAFVSDVLDRYRTAASNQPSEENTFKFYQMDVTLSRGACAPETTRAGCR